MTRFRSRPALVVIAGLVALGGLAACEPAPDPTSFEVVDAGDLGDAVPGDGICEATEGQSDCTLRAAIEEGNATGGAIEIEVSSSLVEEPIVVHEPVPVIATSTTINGNGVMVEGRLVHSAGALELKMIGISRSEGAPVEPGCDGTIQSTGTRVALEYAGVEAWPTVGTHTAICATGDVILAGSDVGVPDRPGAGPTIETGGNLIAVRSAVHGGDGTGVVVGGDRVLIVNSYVERLDPGAATGELRLADVAGPLTPAISASGSILACTDGGTVTSTGYNADRAGACGAGAFGDLATDHDLGSLLGHWGGGLPRSWMPAIGSPVVNAIPNGTPGLCDGAEALDAMNARRGLDGTPCDIGPVEVETSVELTARQELSGNVTGLCGVHVNDAGTVVGTSGLTPHHASVWRPDGTEVSVGDVDDEAPDSLGCGIGDDGTVVGTRSEAGGRQFASAWQEVGGAWQATPVGPGGRGIAFAVNSSGTIIGDDTETGVWWQPAGGDAQAAPLEVHEARALNDAGIAVGHGETPAGTGPVRWNLTTGAVDLLATPSSIDATVEDPDVPDGARDVNAVGMIVGSVGTRPVLWTTTGAPVSIAPAGFHGTATAIDDHGNVLLVREGDTPAERGTYLRDARGDIRLLSRDLSGFDLNDHGVVVGIEPATSPDNLVQAVRLQLAIGD